MGHRSQLARLQQKGGANWRALGGQVIDPQLNSMCWPCLKGVGFLCLCCGDLGVGFMWMRVRLPSIHVKHANAHLAAP